MGFDATAAVGAGSGIAMSAGFSSVGGKSRTDIQNTIDRLKRRQGEVESENRISSSPQREKEIAALKERIENLRQRMEKIDERNQECQTCKNREYQDGSSDPGVSFKNASKIDPNGAAAAVRSHEHEHVVRDRAKAEEAGREVIYQNVIIKHGLCPECGKSYVAGGTTTTVSRPKRDDRYNVGIESGKDNAGKLLNATA